MRPTPSVPIGSSPSRRIQKEAVRFEDSISASSTSGHSQESDKTSVPRDVETNSGSGDLQQLIAALRDKSAHVEKLETCGIHHNASGFPTPGPTAGSTTPGLGTTLAMQALREYLAEKRTSQKKTSPGPTPVVITESAVIDSPLRPSSGVSQLAHPETIDPPQGFAAGRSLHTRRSSSHHRDYQQGCHVLHTRGQAPQEQSHLMPFCHLHPHQRWRCCMLHQACIEP